MQWKSNPDRKPLIVKGPRQVGKTESVRRFAEMNYESVVYINFVEEPKYKLITEDGYKTDDIIKNISRMDPSKKFIPERTLIFFDELQEYPEIATALKFFHIDGRFDVICSGSMLGINYRKIESNSVGYKTDYEMKSLDFEEFLWAKGYQEDFIEEDDPEDYVETVLSQVSETRTETTVRRSPFLKNFHIEKRPLSNDVPAGESLIDPEDDGDTLAASDEEERPAHRFSAKSHRPSIKPGIAPAKAPKPAKSATKPHRPETAIVPAPAEKSSSRLGTILTILITILLGAGVGVFVYLAFFQ